jgi:hypothetical protein
MNGTFSRVYFEVLTAGTQPVFKNIVSKYTDEELAWARESDRYPPEYAKACDEEHFMRQHFWEAFEVKP